MNCVSCKEPLVVLELDQIEIDFCVSCGGVWLDAGELEVLLEDQSAADNILTAITSGRSSRQSSRKCPICGKKMSATGIGSDPEIEIDVCRFNHGIWFDRGELEGVLKYFEQKDTRVVKLLQEIFRK